MAKGDIIFKKNDNIKNAYILRKGEIIYHIIKDYEFYIEGNEKIFGASEILLNNKFNNNELRHYDIIEGMNCEFSVIPEQNLLQWLTEYNIGWNIGKHIAEIITNLHNIVIKLENEIKDIEKMKNKFLSMYANVVYILFEEAQKRNVKWFKDFVNELKSHEMYNKGIQFLETISKVEIDKSKTLDKFKKIFHKGEYICNKGDDAESLFILSDGKIKISIDENTPIDVVDDKGSILGEMAILLNDKRTADMIAVEETTLITIDRNEIKDLFKSEPEIFISTLTNLSMRESYNCNYIQKLYDIISKDPEERSKSIEKESNYYKDELKSLKKKLERITNDYNHYEWLKDLLEKINIKMDKINI